MIIRVCYLIIVTAVTLFAQTEAKTVTPLLQRTIQPVAVTTAEVRNYLMRKAPQLPRPTTSEEWIDEVRRIRQNFFDTLIYPGWPKQWMDGPLRYEDKGVIITGEGYRVRRILLEVVPGFLESGTLYEPFPLKGKVPGILNLSGHTPEGKAADFAQKRCIHYARQGAIALNLDWPGFGEMAHPENQHSNAAYLELAGARSLGLFYLSLRKGLDFLDQHPAANRSKLAATGLSGGGWQTVLLGSLDERVAVSVPVAGVSSTISRIERGSDIGDYEQNAPDIFTVADNSVMMAMMAPRPTLLIYNSEDECCFRAPMVKPYVYDAIVPYFQLFGREPSFVWHENFDPGTHNYQLESRTKSYEFFHQHLGLSGQIAESAAGNDVRTIKELAAPLPENNLTIFNVAKKLATGPPAPTSDESVEWAFAQRNALAQVVHYKPVHVKHAWQITSSSTKGLLTRDYRFELSDGLSVLATWLASKSAPEGAPATIVLDDKGRTASAPEVVERVIRDEQVLAVDLLFTGEAVTDPPSLMLLLAGLGDQPLGLRTAHLVAISEWLKEKAKAPEVRVEGNGPRSQGVALVASALTPSLFSEVTIRNGIPSLWELFDKPVPVHEAPELFCFGLYPNFDFDQLKKIADVGKVGMPRR